MTSTGETAYEKAKRRQEIESSNLNPVPDDAEYEDDDAATSWWAWTDRPDEDGE